MSDISIQRLPRQGLVSLRGDLQLLSGLAGLPVPEVRKIQMSDNESLMWMSPDELLLVCSDAAARAAELDKAIGENFITVADVSDSRVIFDLTGSGAESTLAKLMSVDVFAIGADELRRSRLGQVAAAIWRHKAGWRIMCFRSVADYAEAALRNAADGPIAPIPS